MKIALLVAYDGTGFRGFARQRNTKVRTVQGVLEERLSHLLRRDVVTTGAGRTDAGVHAWGQVVSFEAPVAAEPEWVKTRLNRWLAPDVVVRAAVFAGESFDARFSARRRMYEYAVYEADVVNPFLERFAVHVSEKLDVRAMRWAARALIGEHDFASFCRSGEGSTTRRLRSVSFVRRDERLVIRVVADSFCQQMVRSIVGTLLEVGRGMRAATDIGRVLEARERAEAAPVAPAKGLRLVGVEYGTNPFRIASPTP
ncbi:MAG: tRNA pseudouridine(38-40) synthase TruA [Actinomycetota bacterium]|nr:tRNA pseudouridine(38-40) synthase TruA [Actinomycetota bacterium]